MKKATLINKDQEKELSENGYILIKDFISQGEVSRILDLYKGHHPAPDRDAGMWNSLYNVSPENGQLISDTILDILRPRLDALFESYYAPVATFMSKNSNESSTCDIHRDFSTADEAQFQYRNIWIPLVPTTVNNGALYVVRGSHLIFDYALPMFCEWPYKHMQSQLFEAVQTIKCQAGDLVIYLDKTLHGSHVNRSDDSRPVVHFGALHPDVQLLFYFLDRETNQVRAYEVPFGFFFENDFSEPKGRYPLYSTFDYAPPVLTIDEVRHRLNLAD